MLRLNLVSKELREEIKSRHIYVLMKKMCLVIIIVSIFISIILLSAKIILQNNFNRIVEQTTLVTNSTSSYNDKVNKINSRIYSAQNMQSNYFALSYLIENLSAIIPANLNYSLIQMNLDEKKLELRGKASDRDDLLYLKNKLEEMNIFKNIESPIQNILQKKDINFIITADIDITALKEYLNKKIEDKKS